ncbi:hypothetical protein AGDE_09984 [Angomonas deanei]|nr:hypothetical protein AGDE_09984 [Angomonas deanei]|eukprot:EPY29381.1 hypothetical protein AGDE_09984 [Angomonas deanei]
MNETAEEIKLISSILQRLVNNSDSSPIRKDHLQPLISRLDTVSLALNKKEDVSNEPKGRNALAGKEGTSAAGKEKKSTKAPAAVSERRDKPTLKPPSLLARPVPREKAPQDGVLISKEVSKAFSCTLYNALESVTRLTDSKSAHIFVRRGDEMLSIANVGVNLSFPPQLVHHNCLGSVDTDVLSSGISLNRAICNGAHSGAVPLLIFPIYPKHLLQQVCETPIAVLHLEKRLGDSFTAVDETFCYSASNLIGEVLSRVNGMEWTDHFYDPVTQHIVAPFAPTKLAKLPKLATAGTKEADLLRKIEATAPRGVDQKRRLAGVCVW